MDEDIKAMPHCAERILMTIIRKITQIVNEAPKNINSEELRKYGLNLKIEINELLMKL